MRKTSPNHWHLLIETYSTYPSWQVRIANLLPIVINMILSTHTHTYIYYCEGKERLMRHKCGARSPCGHSRSIQRDQTATARKVPTGHSNQEVAAHEAWWSPTTTIQHESGMRRRKLGREKECLPSACEVDRTKGARWWRGPSGWQQW